MSGELFALGNYKHKSFNNNGFHCNNVYRTRNILNELLDPKNYLTGAFPQNRIFRLENIRMCYHYAINLVTITRKPLRRFQIIKFGCKILLLR